MASRPRQRQIPVEGSWRMVDGENDSFDTTILPSFSFSDDGTDPVLYPPSTQSFSEYPSQATNPQLSFTSSQDSIQDFNRHQEDENVILREPFRPTVPSSATQSKIRSPVPQFKMPRVDVDSSVGLQNLRRRGFVSSQSSRGATRQEADPNHYQRGHQQPSKLLQILGGFGAALSSLLGQTSSRFLLLIALYLCGGAFIIIQNSFTKPLYVALSPVCRMPGVSHLELSFCPSYDARGKESEVIDFNFGGLMEAHSQLEQVMEKTVNAIAMPYDMLRSARGLRDLRLLVQASDMQSKEDVLLELDGYIGSAEESADELRNFGVRVGGIVDAIVIRDRWTSRSLDNMLRNPLEEAQGTLLSDLAAWVFYPFQPTEHVIENGVLVEQYLQNTAYATARITQFLNQADAVQRLLKRAERHLESIQAIMAESPTTVQDRREQVFWTLWNYLAGRQGTPTKLDHLQAIKYADEKRSAAVDHVLAVIADLTGIRTTILDLESAYSGPQVVRNMKPLPLSVHVDAINTAVDELDAARIRLHADDVDRTNDILSRGGFMDDDNDV